MAEVRQTNMEFYIDEIKLHLTGGVLELEIDDATIAKIVNAAFRELQRYVDITVFETLVYQKCIDLNPRKINSVVHVYRTQGFSGQDSVQYGGYADPYYIQQYQILSGTGNLYNFSDYAYNLAAWNTALQIRNTVSTDITFIYDHENNKLYVNTSSGAPAQITIEYVPRFESVSDLKSDFWIDVLMKLALAMTKITLGRIRTRFTQSSSLWTQDGETLLTEGNEELKDLEKS